MPELSNEVDCARKDKRWTGSHAHGSSKVIDPDAEFVFLLTDTDCAAIHDGTVYDVPGCDLCSAFR